MKKVYLLVVTLLCVAAYSTQAQVLFSEDFESGATWPTTGPATAGVWVNIDPVGTNFQLEDAFEGTNALITGQNATGTDGGGDVDGGATTATSPIYTVTQEAQYSLAVFFGQRDFDDDNAGDFFRVETSINGGGAWTTAYQIGDKNQPPEWETISGIIPANSDFRIRVTASDGTAGGDIIEAGIDDLVISAYTPPTNNCLTSTGAVNWGVAPFTWAGGTTTNTYSIPVTNAVPVDVTFNVTPSAGAFVAGTPTLDSDGLNQFGTDEVVAIAFDPANGNTTGLVTLTATFDQPITNLSFDVVDIDVADDGRRDQAVVTSDAGNPTTITPATNNPTFNISNGNTMTASFFGGNNGQSFGDDNGTATFFFEGPVTTITVQYFDQNGVANPSARGAGFFGNFSFCPPPLPAALEGNVFDDGNGLTNSSVDGTGIGSPDGTQLYVNLIGEDGNVVASVPVNADGTYSFANIAVDANNDGVADNYQVEVSTDQGVVGNPSPGVSLPSGWVNTGENVGAGAGDDGTVDGTNTVQLAPGVTTSDVNFGINDTPIANDVTAASQPNPGGTTQVAVPALDVTDTEDGTPTTITITELPDAATEGILYYNGVPVVAGAPIANFDPALLTLDPVDGAVTVDFEYTTTDEAGVESAPATVTMPFFEGAMVSGQVTNDLDVDATLNDSDDTNLGGVTVSITDGMGNIVNDTNGMPLTTTTNPDGTYSFSDVPPGDYVIVQENLPEYTDAVDAEGGNDSEISIMVMSGDNITDQDFVDVDRRFDYGDLEPNPNAAGSYAAAIHDISPDTDGDNVPNAADAVWLGLIVDGEPASLDTYPDDGDGIYNTDPQGDDNDFANDEDGLVLTTAGIAGGTAEFTVTVNGNTAGTEVFFGLWIDWDLDNVFEDFYSGSGITASPTDVLVPVNIPSDYVGPDQLNVRVRASETPLTAADFSGLIVNGEVEDYRFTAAQALPVELVSIEAEQEGDDVVLEWITASEENNDYFVVEYSTNGLEWTDLAEIDGQGTTLSTTFYDYIHEGAANFGYAVLYYRLRQVDFDGSINYSDIVVVVLDVDTTSYKLFPNPAPRGGDVTIIGDKVEDVKVYGINGQLVLVETFAGSRGVVFNTGNLASGNYIVVVNNAEKLRLVVQ